jgi:hypothetical protein
VFEEAGSRVAEAVMARAATTRRLRRVNISRVVCGVCAKKECLLYLKTNGRFDGEKTELRGKTSLYLSPIIPAPQTCAAQTA